MRMAPPKSAGYKTTLVVAGFIFGIVAGCGKNPAELQTKYMAEGRHYLSENKSNEAIIEFQNLLKLNPHSPQGHYWLGKAYLQKGWTVESISQFKEASKEDPLLLGAHLELARYGVNSSQWLASKPEIAAILKIDPTNVDGWTFSGQMAKGLGLEKKAEADLTHALALNAKSVPTLIAMGDLKRHQNHPKQANAFYRKALKEDANASEAWTGLGMLAQSQGRSSEASKDFRMAVRSDPSDLKSQIVLANAIAQEGHLHQAIERLKAIPAKKSDLRVTIKIAEYETVLGENVEAIRLLHPFEREKLQIPDIDFVLSTAYMQSGHKQDAIAMIDRLMAMGGVPPFMKIGAARIALVEGRPDETQKILATLAGTPNLPRDYWLTKGQLEIKNNETWKAAETFGKGLQVFPGNESLLLALSDAQGFEKHDKEAMNSLDLLLKKNPKNTDAIARMGVFIGKSKGVDAKIRYYRTNARENPDNPAIETLYILSMAASKKLSDAIGESVSYLDKKPNNNEIRFLLSMLYIQTGQKKLAVRSYKIILARDPRNLRALGAMAVQDVDDKRYAEAESLYRRAIIVAPMNADLYAELGRTLMEEKKPDEAGKAFRTALSYDPVQPAALLHLAKEEILSGHSHQAITHLAPLMQSHFSVRDTAMLDWLWGIASENNGNAKEASNSLQKAVTLAPENYIYHASLADFWGFDSRWRRSLSEFNKSLALYPDNPLLVIKRDWAKIELAKGSADRKFVGDVVKRAESYKKSHPQEIASGLIAARGNLLLGQAKAAMADFDGVLSVNSDNQEASMGKAGILLVQKHTDQASAIVKKLLERHPDNIQGNLVMASIDRSTNNIRSEADHLVRVYRIHPDWIQTGLELSAVDIRLKQFSEAKSIASSLHEANPELSASLALLASSEMGLGEYRRALRDYKALLPSEKNPGITYSIMSVAAKKAGDKVREKRYLELALRNAPGNPMILNNMAFYLADNRKGLPEALGYAKKAIKIDPQPFIEDTAGYVLFRMEDYSRAESHFETAYNAHFRDPEFLYHMGMNEWKLGKSSQALLHLKRSVGSGVLTPEEKKEASKAIGTLSAGG
ncbi:MAG: tetratricopeptide repeat protein [Leptospirales bacterium]